MGVFKYALRMMVRTPLFFFIYAVGLSLMGVLMAGAIGGATASTTTYERPQVNYALVDRDRSPLSESIGRFMETQGTAVAVDPSAQGFQEAMATNAVDYVLQIPEGYGERFLEAARTGGTMPLLEGTTGAVDVSGQLVQGALEGYLGAARFQAAGHPEEDGAAVGDAALEETATKVEVGMLDVPVEATGQGTFVYYLKWSTYPLFAAVLSCTAALIARFESGTVRRRDLASPLPLLSYNGQVLAACLVVTVTVWAVSMGIGLGFFHSELGSLGAGGLAASLGAAMVFSLAALACAYLAGQCGIGLGGANALGNILGMAISFTAGVWMPMDLLSDGVRAFARFLPGIWYTDALDGAARLAGAVDPGAVMAGLLADVGVVLLFALVLFLVGLVVAKLRQQTDQGA